MVFLASSLAAGGRLKRQPPPLLVIFVLKKSALDAFYKRPDGGLWALFGQAGVFGPRARIFSEPATKALQGRANAASAAGQQTDQRAQRQRLHPPDGDDPDRNPKKSFKNTKPPWNKWPALAKT